MAIKCVYHGSDLDGHCSGAIVKHRYPEAILYPASYGSPFPWSLIEGEDKVFMIDFSLPPEEMIRLNRACDLVWIDHHRIMIEAVEESGEKIAGTRETGKAGCELAWEYIFPEKPIPTFVRLLGRYDVWDHSNPEKWEKEILPFQYGVRSLNTDPIENPSWWEEALSRPDILETEEIINSGRAILGYLKQSDRRYMRGYAYETVFEGHRALAVNAGGTSSLFFESVYDPKRHDLMLAYCCIRGRIWGVSLYSEKVDVAKIAMKYGGAGHPGAAGFSCEKLPFKARLDG